MTVDCPKWLNTAHTDAADTDAADTDAADTDPADTNAADTDTNFDADDVDGYPFSDAHTHLLTFDLDCWPRQMPREAELGNRAGGGGEMPPNPFLRSGNLILYL